MRRLDDVGTDAIEIQFDGERVLATEEEPVAVALLAAGHHVLSRSTKFHRPRSPACLRGDCEGCLARVDGDPNRMTCRMRAGDAVRIESQNRVGSARHDLLAMADAAFPKGVDHHELLAGVPGVGDLMQTVARQVAGIGRLPDATVLPHRAERHSCDVLVVGGGPAGIAAALALTERGRRVEVIDDAPGGMGIMRALALAWDSAAAQRDAFERAVEGGAIAFASSSTCVGAYGTDWVVAGPKVTRVIEARDVILATGAHDVWPAFENNDLPGIMTARAACTLLAWGIVPDDVAVVIRSESAGFYAATYERMFTRLGLDLPITFVDGAVVGATGRNHIKRVRVRAEDGEQEHDCRWLFVDAPLSPAYELARMIGGRIRLGDHGYVLEHRRGRLLDGVWCFGEVAGLSPAPRALEEAADALAREMTCA